MNVFPHETDVFIRFYPQGDMRRLMARACSERWRMQTGINLHFLLAEESLSEYEECGVHDHYTSMSTKNFHIESKKMAEKLSKTEIYVVADDDCLIIGKDFINSGCDILYEHSEYGLLSATSVSDGQCPKMEYPQEAIEMHAVGGISFVRQGILSDFRNCTPDMVDGTICDEINRKGFKTGVMPNVKFNHLGAHYSLTSKGTWAA